MRCIGISVAPLDDGSLESVLVLAGAEQDAESPGNMQQDWLQALEFKHPPTTIRNPSMTEPLKLEEFPIFDCICLKRVHDYQRLSISSE